MVRVALWRNLVLVSLCHSCLTSSETSSVSIIERDVEPTTFVTSAATSDNEPIWLVLPLLLDVQPVLLKVDVTRHVPAQIQSFCREHGVDARRCAGAVQQALGEVVNFQRFCKNPAADGTLPGFVVAKNVLRESGESGLASWLQNDPEDVAIDFCGFARTKDGGKEASKEECAEALGKALRLSFDWMLALTPCEQQSARSGEVTAAGFDTISIIDRLATVEEMIDALHSSSASEGEDAPSSMLEEGRTDNGAGFREDIGSVEEVSQEEEAIAGDQPSTDDHEEEGSEASTENDIAEVNSDKEDVSELRHQDEAYKHTEYFRDELSDLVAITSHNHEEMGSETNEEMPGVAEVANLNSSVPNVQSMNGNVDSEVMGAGSCEVAYDAVLDEELVQAEGEHEPQQNWKVGAALVLALSIVYLAIDLVIRCVSCVAGHFGAPKQLVSAFCTTLLLMRGGPRSTLTEAYSNATGSDDLKKPVLRGSTVLPAGEPCRSKLESKNAGDDDSAEPKVMTGATCHASPSFTCVAMMLMAGRHAPISHESFLQDTLGQPNLSSSSFVQNSIEAVNGIRQQCQHELAAVQRIQKAWKSSQRMNLSQQAATFTSHELFVKSDSSAPIFRLLQLRSMKAAHTPRADKATAGLHRLVPSNLPPL